MSLNQVLPLVWKIKYFFYFEFKQLQYVPVQNGSYASYTQRRLWERGCALQGHFAFFTFSLNIDERIWGIGSNLIHPENFNFISLHTQHNL